MLGATSSAESKQTNVDVQANIHINQKVLRITRARISKSEKSRPKEE